LCRTNLEEFFVQVSNCSHILEIEAGDVGIGALRPTWLGSVFPPNMSHLNLELKEINGLISAPSTTLPSRGRC
jgi:hypothetical protein